MDNVIDLVISHYLLILLHLCHIKNVEFPIDFAIWFLQITCNDIVDSTSKATSGELLFVKKWEHCSTNLTIRSGNKASLTL